MIQNSRIYKIFIIAGEASGDVLGGKLIRSLKIIYPNILVKAVGGNSILNEGAELLFNYSDIALMGYIEILPNLPRILMRLRQTVAAIEEFKPDIIITIDSPGFNFRVISRIRRRFGKQFLVIHYVAPTVWAYKRKRAEIVAKLYDHILLLLPFEKQYFDEVGIPSTFVGHPIVEDKISKNISRLNLEEIPIIVMPGSRLQEINYMGKIFADAIMILKLKYNLKTKALIPTLPHLKETVDKAFSKVERIISVSPEVKQQFFKSARIGLVKSGTSSLELAKYGIPCVVGYKLSSLTYAYLKRIVYIKFISLVNLILNKSVVPEMVQNNCTADKIAYELNQLLIDKKASSQKRDFRKVMKLLNNDAGMLPSDLAAKVVLNVLTKN